MNTTDKQNHILSEEKKLRILSGTVDQVNMFSSAG